MRTKQGKPRIALALLGCAAPNQVGGAERQFANLLTAYRARKNAPFELHFATMRDAARSLEALGVLSPGPDVHTAPNPPAWKLGAIADSLSLARLLYGRRFDLVHVIMPSAFHTPGLGLYARLRGHTALTMNATDCTVAHRWHDPAFVRDPQVRSYKTFLRLVPLDGIFSWYTLFRDKVQSGVIPVPGAPLVTAAKTCFTDLSRFAPAPDKDNTIVYASRLVPNKKPQLFAEAVRLLRDTAPQALEGWTFQLFGNGPLLSELEQYSARHGLGNLLQIGFTPDLAPTLARSKAFVSTQDYENFTSLSMLEAMASGNAILARDVGQTAQFVRHGENGMLLQGDSPQDLAQAMGEFIAHPERHRSWGQESVRLATEVHTVKAFTADIEAFWTEVLARCAKARRTTT